MVSNDLLCVMFILSLIQTICIVLNTDAGAEYNISHVVPMIVLGITTFIIFVNGWASVANGGTIWN